MSQICIALDAMGGDHGPSVVVPAALRVLKKYPQLSIIVVGDRDTLQHHFEQHRVAENPRLSIKHATQQIGMDESPALAFRHKKDSSMRLAINLVKEKVAHACVSAGNTGALMVIARHLLKTIPGVDRPAIISSIPTITGKRVRVLDLGANVDAKKEHLLQFAVMGSVLASAVENIQKPSVGLLNIGHEDIKGNELVKQTSTLLQANSALNYVGYIEADEVFQGEVDIVVCDGFVGNIALKASEGTARLFSYYLKQAFLQNWLTKLAGLCVRPILQGLRKRLNPELYNGASFLGLQGIVIKSHGSAGILGFACAIEEALIEINKKVPQQIHDKVALLLASEESGSL